MKKAYLYITSVVPLLYSLRFHQKSRNIDQVLEDACGATAHGGHLMLNALAREFGLWERLRRCPLFDPCKNKSRGVSPDAIVVQWVFSFCRDGMSFKRRGGLAFDLLMGSKCFTSTMRSRIGRPRLTAGRPARRSKGDRKNSGGF